MSLVSRTISLDDMTPEEMAKLFAAMGSDEQIRFFSALRAETKDWPGSGWCMQCSYIAADADTDALFILGTLAGHVTDRLAVQSHV